MAKVHKVELYLIDANSMYGNTEQLLDYLLDRTDINYRVKSQQESEEFEWEDDIAINYGDATIDDYEEYFK